MKSVKLARLVIDNFKGCKYREIEFGQKTIIKGENESGKTTIFDAFTWLLFGKDSDGDKKFGFKPVNTDHSSHDYGEEIHNLSTSVEGLFLVDGVETTLKKVSEENWVTKRGESTAVFSGNVQTCSVNGLNVPVSKFKEAVDGIVEENLFRLLTDPLFFNTLPWKKQRAIVFEIIGNIELPEVQAYEPDLNKLNDFIGNNSVETAKELVAQEKKLLKDEQKKLPSRIDEASRNIGEPIVVGRYQAEKEFAEGEIKGLQEKLADRSKANESLIEDVKKIDNEIASLETAATQANRDRQKEIDDRIRKLEDEQFNAESSNRIRENKIRTAKEQIESCKENITLKMDALEALDKQKAEAVANWKKAKAEAHEEAEGITSSDATCHVCGQSLPEDQAGKKKREMLATLEKRTESTLDAISKGGKKISENIERTKMLLSQAQDKLSELEKALAESEALPVISVDNLSEEISSLKLDRDGINIYFIPDSVREQIADLQEKKRLISVSEPNNDDLMKKIQEAQAKVDACNEKLYEAKRQQEAKNRVEELTARLKEVGDMVAELDRKEYLCDQYVVAMVELAEQRVADYFGDVEFKLFNKQINGGISPTCETLVKGVPWGDANDGHRYLTGLKIINVLSDHYKVVAPVFIDNRERVNDWNIPEMDAQTIHLFVSTDSELVVEVQE